MSQAVKMEHSVVQLPSTATDGHFRRSLDDLGQRPLAQAEREKRSASRAREPRRPNSTPPKRSLRPSTCSPTGSVSSLPWRTKSCVSDSLPQLSSIKVHVTKHDLPATPHVLHRKYECLVDSASAHSRVGFAGEAFKKPTKRKEEHYHAMAMELQRNGEYREAVKAFTQAIAYEPTHLASHLDLGLLLSKLGKHAAAKTCYSHVVRLDSKCTTGILRLAAMRSVRCACCSRQAGSTEFAHTCSDRSLQLGVVLLRDGPV